MGRTCRRMYTYCATYSRPHPVFEPKIRLTPAADLDQVMALHRRAFGPDEGPVIVPLVERLHRCDGPGFVSLVATMDAAVVGHILFTRVWIGNTNDSPLASILSPLAVAGKYQRKGIGGQLIQAGLGILRQRAVAAVFVYGDPDYYWKFGFVPARAVDMNAPYPLPEPYADAWMYQQLGAGHSLPAGVVTCEPPLMSAEYW